MKRYKPQLKETELKIKTPGGNTRVFKTTIVEQILKKFSIDYKITSSKIICFDLDDFKTLQEELDKSTNEKWFVHINKATDKFEVYPVIEKDFIPSKGGRHIGSINQR
jgi:hypothetical protein